MQRSAKVAAPFFNIAQSARCGILVKYFVGSLRKFLHALKPRLRLVEIAVIDQNVARPIQALDIVRIEGERFLVSRERALGIGKPAMAPRLR